MSTASEKCINMSIVFWFNCITQVNFHVYFHSTVLWKFCVTYRTLIFRLSSMNQLMYISERHSVGSIWHTSHLQCFSPVRVNICLLTADFLRNIFPHSSQLRGFLPVWTARCAYRQMISSKISFLASMGRQMFLNCKMTSHISGLKSKCYNQNNWIFQTPSYNNHNNKY